MSFSKQLEWVWIFLTKLFANFSCRWVRATVEFLDVLHSSPYMHVQKKVKSLLDESLIFFFFFFKTNGIKEHNLQEFIKLSSLSSTCDLLAIYAH